MKYTKLNKNWQVAPQVTEVPVSVTDDLLELTFELDADSFPHIDEGDKGICTFSEVYAYRIVSMNREEYENGAFRFKKDQLPWGALYEWSGSTWKSDFPSDKIVVNDSLKGTKLKHFVLFLPDWIVECLAAEVRFRFDYAVAEVLEEKYPKGYFNHYLALFSAHFNQLNVDSYKVYTNLYVQLEGKKELEGLKEELKKIKSNQDVDSYVKIANHSGIPNFGRKQLDEMIRVVEGYDAGSKYVS